ANTDEATALALKDVHALLDGDNISRRDAVEATVRKALRAAKLLSNEVCEEMQSVGRAQTATEAELAAVQE
ncbi:hypothetical protein NO135_26025, partial [Clostridioides difficile]|nr:hypothetical protein [Clostridioides difficile]